MTQGEEKQVERRIRAALDGPSHPLRGDQVEMLLEAVRRRNVGEIPHWSLVVLSAGLLVIALLALFASTGLANGSVPANGFALANGFAGANLVQVVLLIPAINLILSPLAAFVIVRKTSQ
jgi:hypothetical protein